jgi:hypothetical protein
MSLYADNYQDSWLFENLEDADEFYDDLTQKYIPKRTSLTKEYDFKYLMIRTSYQKKLYISWYFFSINILFFTN